MFEVFNKTGRIGVTAGIIAASAAALASILVVLIIPASWWVKIPILIVVLLFEAGFYSVFHFVLKKTLGPVAEQQDLLKRGVQAEATVKALEETGITVNEVYPFVRLKLEVRPPGGQPYQAEIQTLIERLQIPQVQPGTVVPVVFDPADPSKVALGRVEGAAGDAAVPTAPGGLDPSAAITAGASSEKEKERMMRDFLQRADDESEAVLAMGKPAAAVIVQAIPLNVEVNGPNPAMTFLLEVQPEGEAAFQAQVTAAISQSSVTRYEVGDTIYVKYDPADRSRVAIDHS